MTSRLWFQAGVGILLALLIIRLFMEVNSIFQPLVIIVQTIFLPLLLGGVLFYLTNPLQQFLERHKFPRWASILSIFAIIILVFYLFYALIGPAITRQVNNLIEDAPAMVEDVQNYTQYLLDQRSRLPDQVQQYLNDATDNLSSWATDFGGWILNFLQSFLQGLFLLILVPFFLAYMLKDHEKFAPFLAGFFAGQRRTWIRKTLHDIDHTLRSYIQGQLFVSFLVGVMLFIGYLIIKLDYALLLAIIGMATNVIPFLGPYLAVIPALIIALIQDPILAVYVMIIMLVAQQIESNFITPNVMGNALDVHPLTVITIILAAGNIAGLWGIILAIPVYGVGKAIAKNIYARRQEIRETAAKDIE